MKQKLKLIRVLLFVSVLVFMAPVVLSPVLAQTPAPTTPTPAPATTTPTNNNQCPNGMVARSGICFPETQLPNTPIETILLNFMQWLFGIFGFLAIITFIIAGIQYFMAAGNPDTAKKAKQNLIYSIIGILIALSGFIIITAISSFLQGSPTF